MTSLFRRAGTQIARLLTSAADPGGAAGQMQVYTKVVSGQNQLYCQDSAGTVYVLSGPTGPAAINSGYYGSGRDGAVVEAVNRSLDRVYQFTNYTINAGVVLNPARFPIYVNGTLTINATGSIAQNGVAGSGSSSGGTGGGAADAGYLGIGSSGGNGGVNTLGTPGSTSVNQPIDVTGNCKGGKGGDNSAAGAGAAGGTLTLVTAVLGTPWLSWPLAGFYTQSVTTSVNGGSGGGGGSGTGSSTGGKGGGGGGVIVIFANTVVNNGTISAIGGDGAGAVSSGAGGGGGGGGGKIFIITRSYTGTNPTVAGGNGAAGLGGGGTGDNGQTGIALMLTM